ncbi:aryl hydrocarbon receptor protein 1-like isoform X2 [Paramacrobiotus metropolitanus]|uniref:aryl hydrocarbon receptor protein 1-like isoform X2 n=1 Tax=Paramacrobiotus metropolitanus TaxID=2943436 RepID=UPI0024464D20|nr:aryl hydrocarbon receptor protein 1-like isoform X2 [Paramacrobiotus metropolitanus]
MYATKRRRRSVKGNNKSVGPKDLPCNGTAPSSVLKTNPSKRHRERLNSELERLAGLLPFDPNIISKLDKLSILRLSVSYLRIKSYFQELQIREHALNYDVAAAAAAAHHRQHHHHAHKVNNSLSSGYSFPLDPTLTHTDSVLEALNGFILVVTCNDGEIFFASSSAEAFLGFHQSDLIHYMLTDFIHSEDRPELMKQLSFPAVSQQVLERCFSVRFRCLLDNTSGFLRMEIRGRIGHLYGQTTCHSAGTERQLGLIAICSPYGPPALLDNAPRDAGFKSKHKLDLSLISLDSKGKALIGCEEEAASLPSRNFYNWLHPDDLAFVASAHRTLVKHGSSNLLAYRIANKSLQWQWLQSTFKTSFKNGKPDHVVGNHQPLGEEEARDRLPKRDGATHDLDVDTDKYLDEPPPRPSKPKKQRASPTASLAFAPLPTSQPQQRRRKSFSADITARPADTTAALYTAAQFPTLADSQLSSSLNYCPNAYSLLDSARLFGSETLLPYSQYGSGFYSSLQEAMPQGATGTGILDGSRSYEFYPAGAYNDVMPTSGDYLKSYYKTMDVFPGNTTSSYSNCNMNGYDAGSASPYLSSKPSWMSHHRQSVVVWNNNPTRSQVDALKGGAASAWASATSNGSAYSLLSSNGYAGTNGEEVKYANTRHHRDEKERSHLSSLGVDKPVAIPAVNFSIAEATNTLLDTAG